MQWKANRKSNLGAILVATNGVWICQDDAVPCMTRRCGAACLLVVKSPGTTTYN